MFAFKCDLDKVIEEKRKIEEELQDLKESIKKLVFCELYYNSKDIEDGRLCVWKGKVRRIVRIGDNWLINTNMSGFDVCIPSLLEKEKEPVTKQKLLSYMKKHNYILAAKDYPKTIFK